MKRLLVCLMAAGLLFGCSSIPLINPVNPGKETLDAPREGKRYVELKGLEKGRIVIMPLRSTLGSPIRNNTVEKHLYGQIAQKFPQLEVVYPNKVPSLIASNGREAISQYHRMLDKYFVRGRFAKDDLSVFGSANVDYVMVVSLNSESENASYPENYLFLLSFQIWEVNTGRMVWDITQEGSVLIQSPEDVTTDQTALIQNMCYAVTAKLF